MRGNLWDDPRITKMCDITGQSEAAIVGACYWLWSTADQHSDTGTMSGLSLSAIDRKTGVKGVAQAMVDIGWLAECSEGVQLLRFGDHNGASAKKRSQNARRVSNYRSNDDVTLDDPECNARSVTGALAREEKRREEDLNTLVPSVAEDLLPPRHAKPDCPHQAIVDLYHEKLPQCPAVRDWTPSRQTQLRARWNENPERQDLGYWSSLFEYISTCDFLVGRSKSPFFADLEWITKSQNFTKIREGKYENRHG